MKVVSPFGRDIFHRVWCERIPGGAGVFRKGRVTEKVVVSAFGTDIFHRAGGGD